MAKETSEEANTVVQAGENNTLNFGGINGGGEKLVKFRIYFEDESNRIFQSTG